MAEHTGAKLINALRAPGRVASWNARTWTDVISLARRELMLGHLAAALEAGHITPPKRVQENLADALRDTFHNARRNRQEAERLLALLAPLGCPVIVLKGTAYTMAGIAAGQGRLSGDIDLLVPRDRLDVVEARLLADGWLMQKTDPYDMAYYRHWMHELPPMQHAERGTNLDLHHTIMPLTARLRPDAAALVASAVPLGDTGLIQLCPADQVLHSAVHLFYDGDLTGGLRNLHDLHRLISDFGTTSEFWQNLAERTTLHGLCRPMFYALRYVQEFFGTLDGLDPPAQPYKNGGARENVFYANPPIWPVLALMDILVTTRLKSVDAGPHSYRVRTSTLLLYIRAHWLKMPPRMLAKHLWTKWRRGKSEG